MLIIYEILNALRKGMRLLKSILEDELLAEVLRRVMRVMKILYTKGLDAGILRTSFQLGIIAHDSSYMVPAVKARFYSSQRR